MVIIPLYFSNFYYILNCNSQFKEGDANNRYANR